MIITIGRSREEEALVNNIHNIEPGTLPEFSPSRGANLEELAAKVDLDLARQLIAALRQSHTNPEKAALKYMELLDYRGKLAQYLTGVQNLISRGGQLPPFGLAMIQADWGMILSEVDKALNAFENSEIAKNIDKVSEGVRSQAREILTVDLRLAEFIEEGFPEATSGVELWQIINRIDPASRRHFAKLCRRKATELSKTMDENAISKLATLGQHRELMEQNAKGSLIEQYTHLSNTLCIISDINRHQGFSLRGSLQRARRFVLARPDATREEQTKLMDTNETLQTLKADMVTFAAKPVPRQSRLSREYRRWTNEFKALQKRYMDNTGLHQVFVYPQEYVPIALAKMMGTLDRDIAALSNAMADHNTVEDLNRTGVLDTVATIEIYRELTTLLVGDEPLESEPELAPAAAAVTATEGQ